MGELVQLVEYPRGGYFTCHTDVVHTDVVHQGGQARDEDEGDEGWEDIYRRRVGVRVRLGDSTLTIRLQVESFLFLLDMPRSR